MSRLRFGLVFTMLLGCTYAAFGLLISLRDFGIGIAIASAALIAYGLLDFIEDCERERAHRRGDR